MEVPEDIHHLPVQKLGSSPVQIEAVDIPDGYVAMQKDITNKAHFVRQKDMGESIQTATICGDRSRKVQEGTVTYLCKDCIKHLERHLSDCLYDEDKQEWYNPKQ